MSIECSSSKVSDEQQQKRPVINVVVAMCSSTRGIGFKEGLPWKTTLREDMKFFRRLTTTTGIEDDNPRRRNAVIMGRKTWESIPERHRPLKGRLNVVLSRSFKTSDDDDVYVCRSFDEAMNLFEGPLTDSIESVFVIGGESVYRQVLTTRQPCRVFLTRVLERYAVKEEEGHHTIPACDVFMPEFEDAGFVRVENPSPI